MKKITNIVQKSIDKFDVIINDKVYPIYADVLLEYKIFSPCEIEDITFSSMLKKNDLVNKYNKYFNFCKRKLSSVFDIKKKMISEGLSYDDISYILEKLQKCEALNDEKYALAFIHDKVAFTTDGPGKIKRDLLVKEIDSDLIDKLLNTYSEDVWFSKAEKIVSKKIKSNSKYSKDMLILNIKKYLSTRGYNINKYSSLFENISFEDTDMMKKEYLRIYNKKKNTLNEKELDVYIKHKLYQKGYNLANYDDIKKTI